MTWTERLASYAQKTGFPQALFIAGDGRVVGTWLLGNDYRVKSGYYGGYPAGYLRRIKALFPEKTNALHLFSGKVDLAVFPGDTVDLNAAIDGSENAPTFVDDAQTLHHVPVENYDIILADPPYSVEDAMRYGITMVKRNLVLKALGGRAKVGTHLVWLDCVLPMYRRDQWKICAVIGLVRSTNHRFRVVTIFEKIDAIPLTQPVDQAS
jgi:hypothetical protein